MYAKYNTSNSSFPHKCQLVQFCTKRVQRATCVHCSAGVAFSPRYMVVYVGGDPLPDAGIGARKFRTHIPEMGDRSVWTDTPADKMRKAEVRKGG